jgi:hypothetical protein
MTKPNLTDGSDNLELEAATQALAPDNIRRHGVVACHASFSTIDHVS